MRKPKISQNKLTPMSKLSELIDLMVVEETKNIWRNLARKCLEGALCLKFKGE